MEYSGEREREDRVLEGGALRCVAAGGCEPSSHPSPAPGWGQLIPCGQPSGERSSSSPSHNDRRWCDGLGASMLRVIFLGDNYISLIVFVCEIVRLFWWVYFRFLIFFCSLKDEGNRQRGASSHPVYYPPSTSNKNISEKKTQFLVHDRAATRCIRASRLREFKSKEIKEKKRKGRDYHYPFSLVPQWNEDKREAAVVTGYRFH